MKNQANLIIFLYNWLISWDTSVLHSCIRKSISVKNENYDDMISEWIFAELQHICNKWVNDNYHTIL